MQLDQISRKSPNNLQLSFLLLAMIKRNLYAPTTLGMDGFMHSRERINMQITNVDNFRSKMKEFVDEENSKNLVFTEDLRNSKLNLLNSSHFVSLTNYCSGAYC